ncbi:MAG: carbohydrate-binding domain-containing protein [Actinomycetes bacterium]
MKTRKRLSAAVAALVLSAGTLAGCGSGSDTGAASATMVNVSAAQSAAEVLADNQTAHTATGSAAADAVNVVLDGSGATADGEGVTVDGVTVTITAGGTYRLSGTLTDGQVVVDAADADVRLILDGVDIASSTTAAISATAVDTLVVELTDGTKNTLSDTDTYAENADVNAALFSAGDLTLTGSGTLTVTGRGNDGIASTDGLVVESGTITVVAADDGIRGKDYLVVDDGVITITAGGDGLKADNSEEADAGYVAVNGGTVTVTADGDGADAATDLLVTGGELRLAAGGGHQVSPSEDASTKGLKSGVITVLEGGTVNVDSADDAVHSDGAVHLNGSTLTAASGDDGVHAEGALTIDAGTVAVTASVEGLEATAVTQTGGEVSVTASDDGVNAAGGTAEEAGTDPAPGGGGEAVGDYAATVTGGTLVINADGDGFDSNGTATISGGTVVVNGPAGGGNGALDVNGSFTVSGGLLVAAGSAGMAVAPGSDSPQGWVSATLDTPVEAGTTLQVVDAEGTVVATFVTGKSVQNLVFSSADIAAGEEYGVYAGGTASGASTGGLAESGELASATPLVTVTAGEAPAGTGGGRGGGPNGR